MKAAGYTAADLKAAGFVVFTLYSSGGFSPKQLKGRLGLFFNHHLLPVELHVR